MTQTPRSDSVEELFKIVQQLVAEERARGHNLEAKTSTLAGFTGAILAVTAGLGRDVLEIDLGGVGDPLFRAFFLITVLALGIGAVLAVLGVLRPQHRLAVAAGEMKQFAELPLIADPPMKIHGRMIKSLAEGFEAERRVNDRKAKLTHYAAVALAVGLVGLVGEALTVLVGS